MRQCKTFSLFALQHSLNFWLLGSGRWHCPTVGKKQKTNYYSENVIRNLKRSNVTENEMCHFVFIPDTNELFLILYTYVNYHINLYFIIYLVIWCISRSIFYFLRWELRFFFLVFSEINSVPSISYHKNQMVTAFFVMDLHTSRVNVHPFYKKWLSTVKAISYISNLIKQQLKNLLREFVVYDKYHTHICIYTCMYTTHFHEYFPNNSTYKSLFFKNT